MAQSTKQKIKRDFIKIMTGSDLSSRQLALMSAKSRKPGPTIWLTACVHGDEVGGIAVIQEVFKKLAKTPLERGAVFAFPLMNPVGFETGSRYLSINEEDLNRSFPGDKNGSLAERIAEKIFSTIMATSPALVLDLHNDWIRSIPYALIDPYPGAKRKKTHERAEEFGFASGFLLINEGENDKDRNELKKTLSGSLLNAGIPALTFELGGSYIVNEKNVKEGVNSILNILAKLKMIGLENPPFVHWSASNLKNKVLKYSHQPTSTKTGIIRFTAAPGTAVKKGQPVAKIYDVFGKHEETIFARHRGVVLGNTDSAVALPGEPIMAFGII